jgi:uncharacterized membrane protein
MTEGQKTIALAVSITLNVVLMAAVAGGLFLAQRAWKERVDRAGAPLFESARTLPQEDQDRLKSQMRTAAKAARPEFRKSRELRRRAAELAAAPTFDRAAVLAALRDANATEMRARGRLDDSLTSVFNGLSAEERKALAPAFEHRSRGMRGRRGDRGRDRRDHGDEPDGPPASDASPNKAPPPD